MDEPTASLDTRTEERIQALLHSEFAGKTVVCVAHRLQGIIDYDAVAVLDKGRLVEHGKPRELVCQADSRFAALWAQSQGSSTPACEDLQASARALAFAEASALWAQSQGSSTPA